MGWAQIIFGWPTIVLTLGLFGVAFTRERTSLGFVGLVSAIPFLVYAAGAPGRLWFSPALLLALGLAAVLLRRGRRFWAAACLAPFVVVVALLAAAVATQP
jgi:hypothetical protein